MPDLFDTDEQFSNIKSSILSSTYKLAFEKQANPFFGGIS